MDDLELLPEDEARLFELVTQIKDIEIKKEDYIKKNKLFTLYPEGTPYSIDAYYKHKAFFDKCKKRVLFIAGNRCGKTLAGAYAMACHLTGYYPDWWDGVRWDRPITAWCAGDSWETTQKILQAELFGGVSGMDGQKWVTGEGMIPLECIKKIIWKANPRDSIASVEIAHVSGGVSVLEFKAYNQGRKSFQGQKIDYIWFDEEPEQAVYSEAMLRTMKTDDNNDDEGVIVLTFTPLSGITQVIKSFCPTGAIVEGDSGGRAVVSMTWEDAPHLSDAVVADMLANLQPWEKDARSKGIPALGVGAVYNIPEDRFVVEPFVIPIHWPRYYGMDVGWNYTAVVWLAFDENTQTHYVYDEYIGGHVDPLIHAQTIKNRGEWIRGAIDPASKGSSQTDGDNLLRIYTEDYGLKLIRADNKVMTGINKVYSELNQGSLKVFSTLSNLLQEYRTYKYKRNSQDVVEIVKENDHGVDGLRYARQAGDAIMSYSPSAYEREDKPFKNANYRPY